MDTKYLESELGVVTGKETISDKKPGVLEETVSDEPLKLAPKVSKIVTYLTEKDLTTRDRPYDLSSAGPYPDY